jgi:hypothetical protein
MEANRIGITKIIPRMRIEKESLPEVTKLLVGDKGMFKFKGIVKAHSLRDEDEGGETKSIRFTSIKLDNNGKARKI